MKGRRSGIQGVATSPVIVGAVTVLVVIVAVFLAYNANNGLPFVSTYDIKARVPNANALVKGNEVRIGGSRVGTISAVKPVQLPTGEAVAELDLKLDKSAEPLPVDSTMIIRPKSPLGLKFLQINPGNSSEDLAAGDTIPLAQAKPEPVDIDQFFSMFNEETRTNVQRNLTGFGNAFAGRAPQLNEALGTLRKLAESSGPVLRSLVAPSTNFDGFWRALEDLASTVAPVALTNSDLFVALDRTFGAFARVARPFIQETIEKGPPFLDAAARDLPVLRPFLHDSARFFTAFAPGAKALADTSPTINAALRAGDPGAQPVAGAVLPARADRRRPARLPGSPRRHRRAQPADRRQRTAEAADPIPRPGPDRLQLPDDRLQEPGQHLQRNERRRQLGRRPRQRGAIRARTARRCPPRRRRTGLKKRTTSTRTSIPNTAAPGQTHECEAGNVVYEKGVTRIGNVPGNQGTRTSGQGGNG